MAEEINVTAPEPPKGAATLKLKPVIRKPSAAPSAVEQLKSVTQKLMSQTQQIPQQAILHKTGIIADQEMTEAQRNAAKARTARIELSSAIGVSPVSETPSAPMKTIKIRRPVMASPKPAAAPAAPAAPEAPAAVSTPEEPKPLSPSMTQRKTIKIQRPAGGPKPAGKFSIKRPETESAPAEGEVADIADIPEMPAVPVAGKDERLADVPKAIGIISILVQAAAVIAVGALAWNLYCDTQISPF